MKPQSILTSRLFAGARCGTRSTAFYILFALALPAGAAFAGPAVKQSSFVSTQTSAAVPLTDGKAIQHLKDTGQYDSLAAAITGARYGAKAADNAKVVAQNAAHGIQSTFTPEGLHFEVQTGGATHKVAWRLESLGYGAAQISVPPGKLKINGQRVEISRGSPPTPHSAFRTPHLVEWFHNTPGGLEHGFTLAARPAANPLGEPLSLVLEVRGDLLPQADAARQNLFLRDAAGQTVLTYEKLKVWDATGAELPATMQVADGKVTLTVKEANAQYPLTIDPIFRQQAYLKASNTDLVYLFGGSVAVSGDTVVVGSPLEDGNATGVNGNQSDNSASDAGAAYVFERSGTTWIQQAYLKASNTGESDAFGVSVAVSGDTVVVGAWNEASNATGVDGNQTDNSAFHSGAAYVFVRSGTNWTQQAYLKASNTRDWDLFGKSVAISGDTLVVGGYGEDSDGTGINNGAFESGAAYVFVRSGTNWSQQAYLKASNTGVGDGFGYSVAVSADTVVVGALGEDSNATGVNNDGADNSVSEAGAAYIFVRSGTTWSQQAYLKASDTGTIFGRRDDGFIFVLRAYFGGSVGVSGDTVVVGAYGENGYTNGSAYVFVRNGTTWNQQAFLKASNSGPGDGFGESVAVSGDRVVVGRHGEASNAAGINGNQSDASAPGAGAAYVFLRSGTTWSQQAYLKSSNPDAGDRFGFSVSVSGDTVVVGAYGEDSSATGINGNQTNNSANESGAAFIFHAAKPQPVIFLHGVAGSVLKTSGSRIWPTIFPDDVAELNLQTGSLNTEAVDVVRNFAGQAFYAPFISFMINLNGHKEFMLEEDRSRLTSDYMLNPAFTEKPTLFTFPYDWRKANASHVETLHRYIQKIRELHNGTKVNLVVHSMGGLVMRRYLLEYGTEDVDKVVTVGTPILGAPEVAYRMLTGDFFPFAALDLINGSTMKPAIATMPAVHELLPSTLFLQNWGFPVFEEDGFDFNGNGLRAEGYDINQFRAMLNDEASPSTPSLNSVSFHSFLGGRQDNWSADSNAVKFLHIIGKQRVDATAVGVKVQNQTFLGNLALRSATLFTRIKSEGDGTVPTLSSRRLPQFLAPGALVRDIFEPSEGVISATQSAEHTGLMANTEALGLLSEFLDTGTLALPGAQLPAAAPQAGSIGAKHTPKGLNFSLADAVDAPERTWTTGGATNWTRQTNVTHDAVDAAQSGVIVEGQETYVETMVSGPGTLTFWWKVSSLNSFNILRFMLDGNEIAGTPIIRGEVDWQQNTVVVPSGNHLLRWTFLPFSGGELTGESSVERKGLYGVDGASPGMDAGWLDEVAFTPDVPVPEIVVEQPMETDLADGTASRSFGFVKGGSNSAPVTYTLRNIGTTNLTGLALNTDGAHGTDFTVSSLGATNLAPGSATTFTVTFTPVAGTRGTRSAALHIVSNDEDENPFDIALTGTTSSGRKRITVMGCSYLNVRDAQGRENTRLSEIAALHIPGVEIQYGGEDLWMNIEVSSDTELTLANGSGAEALEVEVIEFNNAGTPISLHRYRFAPGTNDWRMAFMPAQAPDLKVDQDNDGNYEPGEVVASTHSSAGSAVDTTAPSIALELSLAGGRIAVSLTGSDGAQPAPTLRYSLDGGPVQTYSAPLDFPPGEARRLKIFAEDAMGNTSGLIETTVNPAIALVAAPTGILSLQWPIADGYVMEETPALGDPWTTLSAKVTRAGMQERVSLPIGSDESKFYRLRSQRVER